MLGRDGKEGVLAGKVCSKSAALGGKYAVFRASSQSVLLTSSNSAKGQQAINSDSPKCYTTNSPHFAT